MVACFYNKKSLKDTLVVMINNNKPEKIINTDLYSVIYDENDKVSGINIFNFSKIFPINKEGFIKPTKNLLDFIKSYTSCDLTECDITNKFIVASIKSSEDIPNTHLHKCVVSIGKEDLNIVCGAKNCRTGLKVVCATVGAILPNAKQINPGSLLGNKSFGMLCSKKELNLNDDKFNEDGIIELDDSYTIGEPFDEIYTN